MTSSTGKRWDTLKRSLRVCHDLVDSGLLEIQTIGKKNEDVSDHDSSSQLVAVRRSVQDNLKQANQLIDEMASSCVGDAIKSAQLSRMEEITLNYSEEFHHTAQSVEQKIERRKLLRSSVIGSQNADLELGPAVEQQQLLHEKDVLTSSLNMLSNVLSQGRESFGSLARQEDRLGGVGKTLHQFTQKFPQLRSVMSRIHRAKLKQTIILVSVVAFCLLFTLWYSFK